MAAADTPRQQRYQGVQKESAGYKLMQAMGWKEGEGLGADKQGIKEHIRVKKNHENWGVGAVTAADRAREWTTGMAEFHRVLSTLSEVTSQHAGKKGNDDEESSDDDDDEDSDASDGDLKKKKDTPRKKQKKVKEDKKKTSEKKRKKKMEKEKKAKKKSAKRNVSSSSSSSSSDDDEEEEEEEDAVAEPVHKRVKLATHLGRFKKRESAKMVQNYSAHDLAAILGEDPFAAAALAYQSTTTAVYQSDESSDESEDDEEMNLTKKNGGSEKKKKKINKSAVAAHADDDEDDADAMVDTTECWWSNYFVRRGRMGSLRRKLPDRARGFSEKDQTDVYTAAQENATQGRIGLGRSSMPKKVAGVRWGGTKTRLDSDDDDDDDEEDGDEEDDEKAVAAALEKQDREEEAQGVVITLPGGKKYVRDEKSIKKYGGDGDGDGKKEIKWKKVVAEVLKGEAGGMMKMKALQKAVMEKEGLGKERKIEVAVAVAAAVEESSKFKLRGKSVCLK